MITIFRNARRCFNNGQRQGKLIFFFDVVTHINSITNVYAKLSQVQTVLIVIMENRSFDHMLGHLSLPSFNCSDGDGLSNDAGWLQRLTNLDNGSAIQPFLSLDPYDMPDNFDSPHEQPNTACNLGTLQNNVHLMDGFATAIPNAVSTDPEIRRLVMNYFRSEQVPMSHFLRRTLPFATMSTMKCHLRKIWFMTD